MTRPERIDDAKKEARYWRKRVKTATDLEERLACAFELAHAEKVLRVAQESGAWRP